ncbi:hypothetical protein [Spongiactinospora rosea]|uniref:hypothetical protein n=1 Tax=Spongiactinospora rosea TaxID=2248750 RepID=UPI0011C066E2|nr:hypothetical protein [Spongiactinospora rosea]
MAVDLVKVQRLSESNSWAFSSAPGLSAGDLAAINAIPAHTEAHAQWFRRRGGVDIMETDIEIVARGNRDRPVRIMGMKADTECREPLSGAYFESPSAGAPERIVKIGLDLDEPEPRGKAEDESGNWSGDYFQQNTISLKPDEEIVFHVKAWTLEHHCRFSIVLEVLDRGVMTDQVINDGDKPFQVTAAIKSEPDDFGGTRTMFSRYDEVYIGGVANPYQSGWIEVDPSTSRPLAGQRPR